MVEVQEVSNKMQSQMHLDAVAVGDEDLPLPTLFDKASRIHSLTSSSSLDQVRSRIPSPS
jgi:immunoglobulin-binding protein 1